MEVLSDILKTMHVEGSVYFCDLLEAPWSKSFVDSSSASFHMVRRGECRVQVGQNADYLGPGDLVFLGAGVDHHLSSYPQSDGPDQGRRKLSTLLLCGYCEFDQEIASPINKVFPEMAVLRSEELARHAWLKSTLDQLGNEYLAQGPGSELIVNKLTEVVLIELIRINFGKNELNSFLLALNDKAIAKALALIHHNPQASWTLDRLAGHVALSRAAFARRFKALIGQGMFQYLTELRIQKAKELLLGGSLSVDQVAEKMGYGSDVAFVKTFKKLTGMTPRQFQKKKLHSHLENTEQKEV